MIVRLSSWWDALPSRRRGAMRYGLPLVALTILIGLDWWWLQRKGTATPKEAMELLRNVGWTFAVGAVVLMLGVRRWPLQSLGLLPLMLGLAGMFIRLLVRWGPQPVNEAERDLIQACLDVGSRLFVLGLIVWLIGRAFGYGSGAPTNGHTREWDGESERRIGPPDRRQT